MASLFFVGLNPRFQQYSFIPKGLNVMYSATGFWGDGDWRRPIKRYQKHYGLRWLDSGGFTALNRWGDYPFSLANYLNLVCVLRPDFYASMDYPCEPEISRHLALWTNEQRIRQTVTNAVLAGNDEVMIPHSKLVPVIQGYTLDEYKFCIDLYRQNEMIRDYMAVGSMCRRLSDEELHKLIPAIYDYARLAGVKRLHFFGLKLSPALNDLRQFIWSCDSAVAMDDYDADLRTARNGRRWPRTQQEKRPVFNAFLQRLNGLNLKFIV